MHAAASGVTPCVSGDKRRFSAGSGERPAIRCWQQLAGAKWLDSFDSDMVRHFCTSRFRIT